MFVRVQKIGHNVFGKIPIGLKEIRSNIQVVDPISIVQFSHHRVGGLVDASAPIPGRFAARENGQKKDLRLRNQTAKRMSYSPNTCSDFVRSVTVGVVCADHHHGQFRANVPYLTVD